MRDPSTATAARAERVKLYFELSRLGAWGGKGPAAIDYARKAVAEHEKLPPQPIDRGAIVLTRMQLADVADTYGSGDPKLLAEALHQTRLAVRAVREGPNCEERSCRDVKAAVLTRAPIIFMHQDLIQEALALRDGVDLAEDLLAEDPGNTSATASLRFGLLYLGWLLNEVGRLEDSLRARRRLLEISAVLPGSVSSPEERLKEAIACIEVGRTLVALKRLQEAHGYFDRGAEILANPPTENIYWLMRQTDVFQDLGLLHEKMGRPAAARTEFAKASAAAAKFLEKAKSSLAKEIEARSHYLEGKALLAIDKPRGCELLGKSVNRIAELKANGPPNKYWEETAQLATQAMRPCLVP
jgi:tetratricopeptide (TPR) repeat protein